MNELDQLRSENIRLLKENEALNEQVKLLVQTEQRLHRSQSALDGQLVRMEHLADFALRCSEVEQPEQVLIQASSVLVDLFDVDESIALYVDLKKNTVKAGNEGEEVELDEEERAFLESLGRVCISTNKDLPLSNLISRFFSDIGAPKEIVVLPVRADSVFAIILAVKGEGPKFFFSASLSEGHGAFLNVLGIHCERAFQSALLKGSLRSRGKELAEANQRLKESLDSLERAQKTIVEAKKLEAVGRLAGGVAHDFNNLLTVVQSHAELIAVGLEEGHAIFEDVSCIIEAATRAAEITRMLLAFGRKEERKVENVDLNQLTTGFMKVLSRLIGERIQLDLWLDPSIGTIRADRTQVEQIIMNLVLNARDAMPGGGWLTIATRKATLEDLDQVKTGSPQDSHYVVLEISDTGHGMDEETRARIFEPFFTTKDVGSGTGLGLSQVYGLATQNHGHIHVQSEIGKGTLFLVVLPAANRETREIIKKDKLRVDTQATILLVEDEDSIRRVTSRVLTLADFRVLEARNGIEALTVLDGIRDSSLDLVITDVLMPEMTGVELAKELRTSSPELPVIFVSGYTRDELDIHGLDHHEHYLPKPFTPSILLSRVRDILGPEMR